MNTTVNRLKQATASTSEDDEILAIGGADAGPYLPGVSRVDAYCQKIERQEFGKWRKEKLIFHFGVLEPAEHQGVVLKMFVQIRDEWKKKPLPRSSSLQKAASVALRRPATRRDQITYKLWVGKIFRCSICDVMGTEAGQVYSKIDKLIERLA